MQRREFLSVFLRTAGCYAVAATAPRLAARVVPAPGLYHFPQGLASGDPTPTSVMLWTRVATRRGSTAPVNLRLEVSLHPDFSALVATRDVDATSDSDHTVRVLVTDLTPDTTYYYRFWADGDVTDLLGRTRTAPAPDSDRPVRLAFASCQSYEGGYYHAWRTLLDEDLATAPSEQLDFVLHLGDFIYEALGYGTARTVPDFADAGDRRHALTLADYRHLYKTYLTDPDLRAARARWPFICTWDDHEFSDDSWQSVSTYDAAGTPEQARKVAANRAWFEFIPAQLSDHPAPTNEARDFRAAAVTDAPLSGELDDHGLDQEPNNLAALATLTIYRSFRFGRHVELIVTDTRSYRSQHPVPGELNQALGGSARYITPLPVLQICDAGRTYAAGHPPADITLGDKSFPNPRLHAPAGTMLGAAQKAWFKNQLTASPATWKVWGNSLPLQPLRLDFDQIDPAGHPAVFTIDSWDGYLAERTELLRHVADHRIPNLVSLTGDHHAHFAGALAPDFDAAGEPRWVGAEFAVAGISSQSVFEGVLAYTAPDNPLRPLTTFTDAAGHPTDHLNTSFLWGTKAALTAARTGGDLAAAEAARNPRQNRHLAYIDTHSYGIARATFAATAATVELIALPKPDAPTLTPPVRRAHFTYPATTPGTATPKLATPRITGQPPYPLPKSTD
jgi:alkaline phosphatase D